MRTTIISEPGRTGTIQEIEWTVAVDDKAIVHGTIRVPETEIVLRTSHEMHRIASLIQPLAIRLARIAVPMLGRKAKLVIHV